MSPIRTIKNQYRGINAHLHSYWQAERKWNRFHNVHVTDIMKRLQVDLYPMGYIAQIEDSLQIRRIGDDVKLPKADLIISDLKPANRPKLSAYPRTSTLVIEDLLIDQLDIDHPYSSIVIRERESSSAEPVAWIELLSQSNKGDTKDAKTYYGKRWALLENGIVFVELDYLHETPATFENIPDYTRKDDDAQPYRIMVLDSRLDFRHGPVELEEFGVDIAPIPMTIPLNGTDKVNIDFGTIYQTTFEEARYGYSPDLDYHQLPLHFDSYTRPDQERIVARMLAIIQAEQAGVDLETAAPWPTQRVSLEEGLLELQKLTENR